MASRFLTPILLLFALASTCWAQQAAVDPEAKPYIGTWAGKEDPSIRLPAPRLKIRKDGTGAYFLGNPEKPLYEFKWKMGEDQLQASVTDGERFFAAIIRPDGKLVWTQVKLRPGVKTDGIVLEKVPSDF
jgi:hypothetical protein